MVQKNFVSLSLDNNWIFYLLGTFTFMLYMMSIFSDSQYLIAKCHGCVNLCDSGFISDESDNPVLPGS